MEDIQNLFMDENDCLEELGYDSREDCSEEELEELEYCIDREKEILEWYVVTDGFAYKLNELKDPTLQYGLNWYWGRETSGQAISMDGLIGTIDLQDRVLEGMSNSYVEGEKAKYEISLDGWTRILHYNPYMEIYSTGSQNYILQKPGHEDLRVTVKLAEKDDYNRLIVVEGGRSGLEGKELTVKYAH